ncbi:MAG: hypothetical protein PHU31_07105 [Anaerotignum sp.]|nr:hypothetical protein [Anaerotignum sp.]
MTRKRDFYAAIMTIKLEQPCDETNFSKHLKREANFKKFSTFVLFLYYFHKDILYGYSLKSKEEITVEKFDIYKDIAERTGGDIYIGASVIIGLN